MKELRSTIPRGAGDVLDLGNAEALAKKGEKSPAAAHKSRARKKAQTAAEMQLPLLLSSSSAGGACLFLSIRLFFYRLFPSLAETTLKRSKLVAPFPFLIPYVLHNGYIPFSFFLSKFFSHVLLLPDFPLLLLYLDVIRGRGKSFSSFKKEA